MPSRSKASRKKSKGRKSRKSSKRHSKGRKSPKRHNRSLKLVSPRKMWDVAQNWGLNPRTNSQKDILTSLRRAKVPVSFYTVGGKYAA